jgi:hypothetical protein
MFPEKLIISLFKYDPIKSEFGEYIFPLLRVSALESPALPENDKENAPEVFCALIEAVQFTVSCG